MRARHLTPTFRPKRPDDEPFIVSLGADSFAKWSRDPARTIAAMVAAPRARTIVAEANGKLVGFAVIELEPLGRAFGPWRSPHIARLDAIAVIPGLRTRGVGRALLETAESVARSAGGVVMTLMTATDNRAARKLFGSAAYLPLFAIPRSYANGDSAIEMFKGLDC